MNWQVVSRPEAEDDVIEIAAWYDSRMEGLGDRFIKEFFDVRTYHRIAYIKAGHPTRRDINGMGVIKIPSTCLRSVSAKSQPAIYSSIRVSSKLIHQRIRSG